MFGAHPMFRIGGGVYDIANSLRFRSANSAYLSRTFGTPTSATVWTFSTWCKRGTLGATSYLLGASTTTNFGFNTSNQLVLTLNGTTACTSTAVFRDPSAWMHIVYQQNGSSQTIYVNNASVATGTTAAAIFNTAIAHQVGAANTTNFFDGHLANVYFIDGQALTPSSFGRTDPATGVWVPKAYSGTYGTNGFFLQFKDAASTTTIGYDTSGNSNNFTTSGISVTSGTTFDQMTDTPTLNYAVWSPIDLTGSTLSAANMNVSVPFAINSIVKSTVKVASGKWYWELTTTNTLGNFGALVDGAAESYYPGYSSADGIAYNYVGTVYRTGSVIQTYSSFTTNDVIGVALDLDNGKIFFSKNGTWQGSSDPAAGTNPAASTGISGKTWAAAAGNNNAAAATSSVNFGQRAFSYTPPTGFKALNTANLSVPSIKKPSLYMDATLRTGTGATASVSSLGFQPDLVWIKSRSAATNHNLFDSARGVQKGLGTNWSGAEYTDANTLTAFNSNGYSLGSDASSRGVNINTNTYVDWAWKKGATPGFDVVTYTGNATNRTISHGLGVVPEMMMIRTRGAPTGSEPFVVYHSKLNGGTNPANYYLYSTQTAAEGATAIFFNNTMPTSSVFTVGTDSFVNQSGTGIVAYLFAGVEGFSKFGSYVGNGAADGPFVWCGFRPAFVLIKQRDGIVNWEIMDSKRDVANPLITELYPNAASAENASTSDDIDFLSNGFKIRSTNAIHNSSGGNYIFAAFAEAPFKYARAR